MTTVTLWLLISIGGLKQSSTTVPVMLIAKFASRMECERVKTVIIERTNLKPPLLCVQARVVP